MSTPIQRAAARRTMDWNDKAKLSAKNVRKQGDRKSLADMMNPKYAGQTKSGHTPGMGKYHTGSFSYNDGSNFDRPQWYRNEVNAYNKSISRGGKRQQA